MYPKMTAEAGDTLGAGQAVPRGWEPVPSRDAGLKAGATGVAKCAIGRGRGE